MIITRRDFERNFAGFFVFIEFETIFPQTNFLADYI